MVMGSLWLSETREGLEEIICEVNVVMNDRAARTLPFKRYLSPIQGALQDRF
jgi:hypothetical protein